MKVFIITEEYRKGGGSVHSVYLNVDKADEELVKLNETEDCEVAYDLIERDVIE